MSVDFDFAGSWSPPSGGVVDFAFIPPSTDFAFAGGAYTPPAGNAVDFEFGAPPATVDEITIAATLPLPAVAVVVDGLREVAIAATLPPPVVSVSIESGVALIFSKPAPASTDLVFQFGDGDVIPRVDITVAATLPPPTLQAAFIPPVDIEVDGMLPGPILVSEVRPVTRVAVSFVIPGPVVSGEVEYRSNTQRPTVGATSARHQVATGAQAGATHRQQDTSASPAGWAAFWQRATGLAPGIEHRTPPTLKADRVSNLARHQDATPAGTGASFAHQVADRSVRKLLASAFENAASVSDDTLFKHQDGDRTKRVSRLSTWKLPRHIAPHRWSGFQPAAAFLFGVGGRYQEGVPPPPGVSTLPPEPPGPTPCYTPNPHLLFSFPPFIGGNLVFQCGDYSPGPQPGQTIIVPVRRVYIVINDTSLRRVDGNIDLKASRISLSLDIDTWAWGLTATLPLSSMPDLEQSAPGVPVEVEATINGTAIRALVESVSRQRTFTDTSLSISGRGKTSLLAGGYAGIVSLINDQDRTAQQLCADLLLDNGVPMPWTVDWQLTDWLVPAGAFVHQGDRISGLVSIAEAAGGFLRPHNSLAAVSILPRHATAPWNWASVTPEFVLPSDVTSRESMEWIERPTFNRVFVSGEDQGVLGQVTRTGTAGDLLAPMVTHPLITHADAARQRGIAELAKGGRIIKLGLRLPVLEETGVLLPGHMVQYDDAGTERIGRVNSVQVDVSGGADVWQAIELEAMA